MSSYYKSCSFCFAIKFIQANMHNTHMHTQKTKKVTQNIINKTKQKKTPTLFAYTFVETTNEASTLQKLL